MNNIKVNNKLGVIKSLPVVLGLGVLTYKGVNKLIEIIKIKKSKKSLDATIMIIKGLVPGTDIGQECDDTIHHYILDYAISNESDSLVKLLKDNNIPSNTIKVIFDMINLSLNIKEDK